MYYYFKKNEYKPTFAQRVNIKEKIFSLSIPCSMFAHIKKIEKFTFSFTLSSCCETKEKSVSFSLFCIYLLKCDVPTNLYISCSTFTRQVKPK